MIITNKQKAFFLSVLVTGIFALVLLNLQLSASQAEKKEIMINLQDVKLLEDLLEKEKEALAASSTFETHKEFNEAEQLSEKNPSQTKTETEAGKRSESAEKRKSRDELLLEELENERELLFASENGLSTENNPTMSAPAKTAKPKKEKVSNLDNSSKDIALATAASKNTTAYYNLVGRKAVVFPNPVYTCPFGGKIVINIKVDATGKVMETSYNQASSTSTNGCLIENAMEYAADAVFDTAGQKPEQLGTITYIFPGQGRN